MVVLKKRDKTDRPRGLIKVESHAERLVHERLLPAEDLAYFVEHFWSVRWRLGAQSQQVETLPYPSVHVVVEPTGSQVIGIMTGKFSRELTGDGFVFGIKFRPGAFYPFLQRPVHGLRNKVVSPKTVFGRDFARFEQAIVRAASVEERQRLAEDFLRVRLPARDEQVERINILLAKIIDDRSIVRVEQLSALSGMTVRNLQRTFSTYVGVSPKWVIGRYRIQDALERARERTRGEPWAALARELGYADQAHFVRDFKGVIGLPPQAFVTRQR